MRGEDHRSMAQITEPIPFTPDAVPVLFNAGHAKFIRTDDDYLFIVPEGKTHATSLQLLGYGDEACRDAGYLGAMDANFPVLTIERAADTIDMADWNGYERGDTVDMINGIVGGVEVNGAPIRVVQLPIGQW